MNQQPKTVQTIILIAILALVLVVISSSLLTQNSSRLAYSDVLDLFENERVESFVLQGDTLTMTLYASDTAQAGTAAARIGDIETFHKDLDETIAAQSASGILKSYNYLPAVNSIWRSVLPYLVVGVALLFVWFILMNRSGGSPNASMQRCTPRGDGFCASATMNTPSRSLNSSMRSRRLLDTSAVCTPASASAAK